MASRLTSGSSRSTNKVDPPRSANSTVTVLRTAAPVVVGVGEGNVPPTGAPHWSQNRAPAASSAPHDGHGTATGDPQDEQNRAPSRFSIPHSRHFTPQTVEHFARCHHR